MTVYTGTNRSAGGRFFWVAWCFTNASKVTFWSVALAAGALDGLLLGLLGGIAVASMTAAPIAATGVGAPLGAIVFSIEAVYGVVIGGLVGVCAGFTLAWRSACPECGSCVEILYYAPFWPVTKLATLIPVFPVIMRPSKRDCAALIPPGCP